MTWAILETNFSSVRMEKYKSKCGGKLNYAAYCYQHNLLLSKALVPMLHTLEISLRNRIQSCLEQHFEQRDWWHSPRLANPHRFLPKIQDAITKLRGKNKPQTVDDIIGELNFGFWCRLFNSDCDRDLWAILKGAFPHIPRRNRRRKYVSGLLNNLRELRNRSFHHEPILWVSPDVTYQDGLEIISYMDSDLATWLSRSDNFPAKWQKYQNGCRKF